MRWTVLLLVWTLALPAVAQESTPATPATQPVITDAQLDEALTHAFAETSGPRFVEPLRSVAPRFREVPVSTQPGAAQWHKVTLNARGRQLDAIRFRVPEGEPRAMAWAFIPPANLGGWYILPLSGEMEGFKEFWRPSAQRVLGKKAPAGAKQVLLQLLPASSLKPGEEYILWFRLKDANPAPLYVTIALPPADENAEPLSEPEVVKTLGLTPEGDDLGAVDLDAPAPQPAATTAP